MDGWLQIGELARRTGLTHRTLRHYDDLGLVVPSGRTGGDYRQYSPDDVRRLLAVQQLKSLGLSLGEIRAALDDPAFDAADALARHIALVEARVAAERDLLARLTRLTDAAGAGWEEVVEVIALTARLRHPEPHIRFRAALEAPASAPVAELLDRLRHDPEPGVREAISWAVAQQGPDAVPAVLARLDDPDAGVRLQLAHVLGKLGDPAAAPALAGLLDDPDEAVAAKAAFALGQVGGAEALGALVAHLGRHGPLFADAVTTALGRFGPEAAPALVEALGAGGAPVRAHAAEALGYRGDAQAAAPLAGALSDPDAAVRFAALVALGQVEGDEAGRAIEGALNSHDERARLLARRLMADRQRR